MRVSGASFLDHRNTGGRRDRLKEAEARRGEPQAAAEVPSKTRLLEIFFRRTIC
jgi:hypothetical protein